jgi:hypothetical protein
MYSIGQTKRTKISPVKKPPEWTRESPYRRFFDFIAPDSDRYGILLEQIKKMNFNSVVVSIEGNRHIFIFPRGQPKPSAGKAFPFKGQSPVILTAHYDRVPDSPGANDNSAAVFQLLKAARRLGERGMDRWIVIFTDKEEIGAGEKIQEQGSFSLAKKLRAWGLGNARIFNFDACGTGDTLLVSTTADYLLRNSKRPGARKIKLFVRELRERALDAARYLRLGRILTAPVPFSADAGFLRAGLPAQTITVLPAKEASSYTALLRGRPEFADLLFSNAAKSGADQMLVPETWRRLNGPADDYTRLTPWFYDSVVGFAVTLCGQRQIK